MVGFSTRDGVELRRAKPATTLTDQAATGLASVSLAELPSALDPVALASSPSPGVVPSPQQMMLSSASFLA